MDLPALIFMSRGFNAFLVQDMLGVPLEGRQRSPGLSSGGASQPGGSVCVGLV